MQDSITRPLYGLVLYGSFPETTSDSAKLLQRLNQAVAVEAFDAIEVPYARDEETWPAIREVAERHRIHLLASAGPTFAAEKLTLCSDDASLRNYSVRRVKQIIDFAYAVGSRSLLTMSGSRGIGDSIPAGIEILQRSLAELASYCEQRSRDYCLRLSIEPADTDIQHRQFLGPSSRVAQLTSQLAAESVPIDVTLDMSHIPQLGENIEYATSVLGVSVGHAHIANVVLDPKHALYGDRHPPFSIPGGEYTCDDIPRFLSALQSNCFAKRPAFSYHRPVVSVEIRPVPEGQCAKDILLDASRCVSSRRNQSDAT